MDKIVLKKHLTDAQLLEAGKVIHDCYNQFPYNYDWPVPNILKYFTRMEKKGYAVHAYLSDGHVLGVLISIMGSNQTLLDLKVMKIQDIPKYENLIYVQDICVAPSAQGKGIGKALLRCTENFSWLNGKPASYALILFTYVDAKAVTFYEHLGFTGIKSSEVKNRIYFTKMYN